MIIDDEDDYLLNTDYEVLSKVLPKSRTVCLNESATFYQYNACTKGYEMMNELWKNNQLCDVTLKAGGEQIRAHRIVLASVIPFFKSMFCSNMKESKEDIVRLRSLDEISLLAFVNFAYTSKIEINMENVYSIAMGASFLQLFYIQDVCAEFIEKRFTPSNVFSFKSLASTLSWTRLYDSVMKYIHRNFVDIYSSPEYLELEFNDVIDIIKKDELQVNSEEEIFHAVMRWIKYNVVVREKFLHSLLQHVRLPVLSPHFLIDVVCTEPLIKSSLNCRDLVDEAKDYHLIPERIHLLEEHKVRVRHDHQYISHIFVVGGISHNGDALSTVEIFDPASKTWDTGKPMNMARSRVGVAVLRNELYAVGGFNGAERLANVEVYNSLKQTWTTVPSMHFTRSAVGSVFLNNKLYVCGGYNGNKSLSTVECFCLVKNNWIILPNMQKDRSALGVVALNNYIYALGGHDGLSIFGSVERYNPSNGVWESGTPMQTKRCRLGTATLDGKIYACGGYDGSTFLKSFEVYDPAVDQWRFLAPMNTTRSRVALVANMGKLWAIGGYDGISNLSSVEVYDPVEDTWTYVAPMSHHEGGVGAGILPYFN